MKQLYKRIRGGAWIAFAGFFVTVVGLALENLDVFQLTETQGTIVLIIGTALISQITKYLNK